MNTDGDLRAADGLLTPGAAVAAAAAAAPADADLAMGGVSGGPAKKTAFAAVVADALEAWNSRAPTASCTGVLQEGSVEGGRAVMGVVCGCSSIFWESSCSTCALADALPPLLIQTVDRSGGHLSAKMTHYCVYILPKLL
jgi:hypothetical protein